MWRRIPIAQTVAFVSMCVLPWVSAVGAGGAQSKPITLAADGQARAVIVVPTDAPTEIARAAGELQHYIHEITGATLPIVAPEALPRHRHKVAIHVGVNPTVAKQAPDLNRCEKDGAWIKTLSDRCLVIAGKTPYGTEFGVYGLLERFCGVRWYLPGPNGTHVPKTRTLRIPRIDLLDNPAFISRSYSAPTLFDGARFACVQAQEMDRAWYRHNRMRSHFHTGHNIGRIIVPSKYGKAHPEYFPEIEGKRVVPRSDRPVAFQPCMTNPAVVRLCADAAARYFDEHPDEMCFSIGINDHGGFCRCAACRAQNGPARLNSRGLPDYSRLMLHFGNRVAAALPKRHKDRYVGMCAYAQARDLPQGMKIHPNLLIARVTAFATYFSPMDRADMAETRRFARACRMFGIMDYWSGSMYAAPVFCTGLMEQYVDWLAALGVKGWNSETYHNWGMDGIKYYLLAQKLWDPSRRAQDLLDAFCRNMVDAGAPDLLGFYRICRERWETQTFATSKYQLSGSVRQVVLFDEPTCETLMGLLRAARAKTANPKGRFLLDRFITTFAYTQAHAALLKHSLVIADSGPMAERTAHAAHREETVIRRNQHQRPISDLRVYGEHVLEALRLVKRIEDVRKQVRSDAFTLPRHALGGVQGVLKTPETIAAPLLAAYDRAKRHKDKAAFLKTVEADMPGLWPKVAWVARHLKGMDTQPELLPGGGFERLAPNRYDAEGWEHGNWGSYRSTANAFVVPQGIEGANCYYLVGVKNCFTYLPSPVIRVIKPVAVQAGAWYVVRARVRSQRNDGLLPEPAFQISFPGARRASLKCSLCAGQYWFDAAWLFRAPQRAARAIVRFLGTQGEGQAWIDGFSMKRVPDAIAPRVTQPVRLLVFPLLVRPTTLPPARVVDPAAPLPRGVRTLDKRTGKPEGKLVLGSTVCDELHADWVLAAPHDLEVRIRPRGTDGATLRAIAIGYAQAEGRIWTKVDRQVLKRVPPPPGSPARAVCFRYVYKPPTRKVLVIVFRLKRKTTRQALVLDRVEVVPVPASKDTTRHVP